MAKYMVQVNVEYMVAVEIDGSAAAAEHHFLDNYEGVIYANAFDRAAMKTDFFLDTFATCEVISEDDVRKMNQRYVEAWKSVKMYRDIKREAEKNINSMEDQLRQLEAQVAALRDQLKAERGRAAGAEWDEAHAIETAKNVALIKDVRDEDKGRGIR